MTNVMGVIIKYFRLTKTLTLPFTHTRPSALQNMKTYGQVCYMVTKASFCYSAKTRKVHMPALNDSKQIGFAVYNVFIPCVIIIPTLNLLRSHCDAVYLLNTLLCLFSEI